MACGRNTKNHKIVTIHQPEHLVWLGLLHKISKADVFVLLDNVQFRKNYFQNRNKIRTKADRGWCWITVPIKKHPFETIIRDIEINYDTKWIKKYFNLLENSYRHTPYFKVYIEELFEIFNTQPKYLSDLNIKIIHWLMSIFNINTKTVLASEIDLPEFEKGGRVNFLICEALNASQYLSGPSGKDYLDLSPFSQENIDVKYHNFNHPIYKQNYNQFIPCMSSIDLLFNHGVNSMRILFNEE